VARTYAGILGPLAFIMSLMRGMVGGGGAAGVLWTAWCSLLAFAAMGWLIGWIAERTVVDSVSGRIEAELAGQNPQKPTGV
jgi:hypothetical protein